MLEHLKFMNNYKGPAGPFLMLYIVRKHDII